MLFKKNRTLPYGVRLSSLAGGAVVLGGSGGCVPAPVTFSEEEWNQMMTPEVVAQSAKLIRQTLPELPTTVAAG